MRRTRYFLKTTKDAHAGAFAESQKLLYRGGFVRQISVGRYALLPLGFRVYQKIKDIIVKEMEAIGAQRMELPIMQPVEVWKVTNRDAAFGELMTIVKDHYGRTFVLSATGEALMTELFGSLKPTYKDLPINVFQFMPKFRDELRPRGGLIRVREFLMKDGYNFEIDETSFMKTYHEYWKAYEKIFSQVKLDPVPVIADNGALGGDYSHEFIQVTPEIVEALDMFFNEDEKELPLEDVDASKDDALYKEMLKIYARTPEKTLKNMVYWVDGRYICIVLRGDYKIDFTKLRRLLSYKQIRPATADEIEKLGSCIGYVSAIGLDKRVEIIVDESVKYNKNYWDGGHRDRVFRKNVNIGRDFKPETYVDVREDKTFSAGGDKIVVCDRCDYKANVERAEFVREPVNMDEEMKPFEIIDQPEWVCTMDDNVEHYRKPKSHFLKNVVYKTKDGKLVIAVLRGDLDAHPVKVAKVIGVNDVEMADDHDLARIGTKSGWVHSWGHDKGREDVIYVADTSLEVSRNLIGGQKEKTTDAHNVNYGRDFKAHFVGDIAAASEGAKCPNCEGGYLHEKKGIELGHIFKYDTYYSLPHRAMFVDKDGKEKPMWMGAYGIGVGRLMASCVEMNHDENGIIWPIRIAPFAVHVVSLGHSPDVLKFAEEIYTALGKNHEVFWDDREDVSAGVKLMDADLIGIPLRIVISEKTIQQDSAEVKLRSENEAELVKRNEVEERVKAILRQLESSLTASANFHEKDR
ncbi:MAG: YbaK/EbsC family protein [Candidatus Dojkabacteria bacterium]|nr:YbaK/EbsC family protein [Candidatus Dojkabacteria bacterium]